MSTRAVIACAVLATGTAAAQPSPVRVVVVPVRPALTAEAAAAVWDTRQAVEAHPALTSVDVTAALSTGGGEESDLDAGRAALAAAREAFGALDLDTASREGERALRLLLRSEADDGTAVEALLLLARVRAAVRDDEGTRGALRRALRLRPDLRLDAATATPSLQRALDAARAPPPAGVGHLRVESPEVPAAVSIDDRFVGVTPRFVDGLPPGPRRVVVEADGRRREVRLVEVTPGTGRAIQVSLEPAPRASLLDRITERLPAEMQADAVGPALADLKALAFAEQAILLDVGAGATRAALFDLRVGQRVRSVVVEAGAPGEAGVAVVRRLYEALDPRAPALAEVPLPAVVEPAGAPGLTDRWWFWPTAGVLAAAAVAIPLLLLTAEDERGLPRRDGAGAVLVTF